MGGIVGIISTRTRKPINCSTSVKSHKCVESAGNHYVRYSELVGSANESDGGFGFPNVDGFTWAWHRSIITEMITNARSEKEMIVFILSGFILLNPFKSN